MDYRIYLFTYDDGGMSASVTVARLVLGGSQQYCKLVVNPSQSAPLRQQLGKDVDNPISLVRSL